MNNFRYITVLVFSLYSILGNAELKTVPVAGKTTLNGQETTIVAVGFNEAIRGDLYVATKIRGILLFFSGDSDSGIGIFRKDLIAPLVKDGEFSAEKDLELFTINAQDIAPGTYPLFQVITKPGSNPLDINNWFPTPTLASLGRLDFNINLANNEAEPEIPDFPAPGSGRFGFEPNTSFSDLYFTPKLRQRVLDYDDVTNSFDEWNKLSPEVKKKTLYWKNNQLLAEDGQGNRILLDNLNQHSFLQTSSNIKLTISEPLTSSSITAYPGCAGVPDLNVFHRVCGEFNSAEITGSEVFSQRWTRLNNLDDVHDPIYANIDDKSSIIYELSVSVGVVNIMPPEVLMNFPLAFEMSVSRVPGDFSENACKPNKAIQYGGALNISLTQAGLRTFDPNLPEICKVNSDDLQHYYINARAVNIDLEKKEINENLCKPGLFIETAEIYTGTIPVNCKFEILELLDEPCEYQNISIVPGKEDWQCKL